MPFWSGETLLARLPTLITPASLFDPSKIDCAAYTLTLGSEVFVTSDLPEVGGPYDGVKTVLSLGQQFRITPGQFGFLVSQESVKVPDKAVAFISMKATYKLRGLINVSGFHVDPGWNAPLLFSVYNAGPSPVCLMQGMPLFLIWFADLDRTTQMLYKGSGKSINADLISNISGEVFSPIAMQKEVGRLRETISKAADTVVGVSASLTSITKVGGRTAIIAISLLIAAIGYLYKEINEIKLEIAKSSALTEKSPVAVRVTPPPVVDDKKELQQKSADVDKKEPQQKAAKGEEKKDLSPKK